jgi:UDP-N-acetylglucosamine 2-epimerase (non-hydrolysing)
MLIDPLGYLDFIRLVKSARLVLTDSGGIQEETTWLGIPCLTVRNTTERPSTISIGTNKLVARNREAVTSDVDQIMRGRWKRGRVPRYWDGHAAERIVNLLKKL